MKIAHICLIDDYSEGWSYHRNMLSEQNIRDGWETTIITSNYEMDINGNGVITDSGVFYTKTGIKLIRLKADDSERYRRLNGKARWRLPFIGLFEALYEENPDLIFVHNVYFRNLADVWKYKKEKKSVIIIGDNHADVFNSLRKGKEWIDILTYKLIIQPRVKRYFNIFDDFFYQTEETKQFFEKYIGYKIPNAKFMPLPAPLVPVDEKTIYREKVRQELNMKPDELLLVHSGKLVKEKKTIDIFRALKNSDIKCKLVLIGSIPDDNKNEIVQSLRLEPRSVFLGWKSADELREYLAAADLYLQPGTQSVTMQNALSAGTPVLIFPHISLKVFCNGCEFQVKDEKEIEIVFSQIQKNPEILKDKSEKAYDIAQEYFGIERQTRYLYNLIENR